IFFQAEAGLRDLQVTGVQTCALPISPTRRRGYACPAMPRTIHVTRYVTPLREGGSMPAVVEADDDGMYVLKFRGAGQGARALVRSGQRRGGKVPVYKSYELPRQY